MFLSETARAGARELWKTTAPNKCRFHFWLVLHDKCWTSDRLQRHGLPHHGPCALCSQEDEQLHHLLIHCVYSREVWFKCLRHHRFSYAAPLPGEKTCEWWLRSRKQLPKPHHATYDSLVMLITWKLWVDRNERTFRHQAKWRPSNLVHNICQDFVQWGRTNLVRS